MTHAAGVASHDGAPNLLVIEKEVSGHCVEMIRLNGVPCGYQRAHLGVLDSDAPNRAIIRRLRRGSSYRVVATRSISTMAPRGRVATPTVERAGFTCPRYSA